MLSKFKTFAIVMACSQTVQGSAITFTEVDDALKVAGGFFNGYGWATLGGEILDFDKGLDCVKDLLTDIETTVNALETDYDNSPCKKNGSGAHFSRPYYDNYGSCATSTHKTCEECKTTWFSKEYYYPVCGSLESGYKNSGMTCSNCYTICPGLTHPVDSV